MKVYFKYFIVMVVAFATTILSACTPDGGEQGGDKPEAPTVIPNNGVGEDGVINLTETYGGIYFGQFWKKTENELWANYYLMLTNDEVGITSAGYPAPMHQGGWVLFLDFWGEASENSANPILPEGTYVFGEDRNWNRLLAEATVATNNEEQVYDEASGSYLYSIKDKFFQSGSVTVTHIKAGYLIEAEFLTTEGETLKFRYEDHIVFKDKSDDVDFSVALEGDIEFKPVKGWTYLSSQKDNCDKHLIYLFDVDILTEDSLHAGVAGGKKLQLTVYTEKGASLAGTYTAGVQKENGFTLVEEKAGLYYPGCYWATMAVGSFVELADKDQTLYSILTDGTIKITVNDDGTHTIVVDGLNDKGNKITCNWTGVLGGKPNAE